jgi:hypothetical protein
VDYYILKCTLHTTFNLNLNLSTIQRPRHTLNFFPATAAHIIHLRAILEVLRQHKLFAKMSKCTFAQPEIEYLDHIINKEGVTTYPSKLAIIQQWPQPQSVTQLRAFLGLTGYYKIFIQGYGVICRPLFDLLMKNSFQWTSHQSHAFNSLKQTLPNHSYWKQMLVG